MSKRSRVVLAAFVAMALLFPQVATALTFTVPSDVLRTVDVPVHVSENDSTGTAVLVVDGSAVRSLPVTPSSDVTFAAVPLETGTRRLQVGLRYRGGYDLTTATPVAAWTEPLPPLLVSPSGGYASKRAPVIVKAGGSTTSLKMTINGVTVSETSVTPNQVVAFGTQSFSESVNTVRIVASNPVATKTYSFRVRKLVYPWPTCIIVDKSDFKLYWIRNGVLVKAYPIAHGKPNTPTPSATWRIGAKYHTDARSVYGPRKMRLFRKVGSTFEYTRFLIHGTDEPWVIGTRASHGCIRMYNKDVLELFPQVPIGTMVQTRD